ncbi:MAG TPA: DUF3857 domain-containing protein [Chitinophagaceae bacterium]|nr:DUF3857 domain-containing protein [Chitinophagaceae bacterium]
MKKTFFLFLITLPSFCLIAQKKIPDFGQIDISELNQTSCPIEQDASAMKIFDIQETDFEILAGGPKLKTERRVRIKIYNEKGYKDASIRIPYLSIKNWTKIKELKGIVYNLDAAGKIITQRLEKKDFFKEKTFENYATVNFTFPNIKPGSVVEYSYTKIEYDITQFDPWIIQSDIPCLYSTTIVTIPIYSQFKQKLFGSDTVNWTSKLIKGNQFRRTTYYKENIPSFKAEPYMSSQKDNLMKMIFFYFPPSGIFSLAMLSSKSLWKTVGGYLLESDFFGGQIRKKIPGTEGIIDTAKRITRIEQRIQYIYRAVKERIPQKTEQTLYAEDILEAWNNRVGNSADINLVLLNLLRKAEITCYPILISTRDNGRVSVDFPSLSQLNGVDVIAEIDSVASKYYIMDASLKFQTLTNPPFNVINRVAFLLNPDNMDWFMIEDGRPLLKQNISLFCELSNDGKIIGEASLQHYNYAKEYILDSTSRDEEKEDEEYFDKKAQGLQIDSFSREITNNEEDPVFDRISFTYQLKQTNDFFFLNPQFLTSQKNNPFVTDTRNTDIDFGCNQDFVLMINLSIPPSFEIDHLPKNVIVRAPDSSFFYSRTFSFLNGTVYMSQLFSIKRPLFLKEEYAGVKESFSRMYTLMNEELILRKKKE